MVCRLTGLQGRFKLPVKSPHHPVRDWVISPLSEDAYIPTVESTVSRVASETADRGPYWPRMELVQTRRPNQSPKWELLILIRKRQLLKPANVADPDKKKAAVMASYVADPDKKKGAVKASNVADPDKKRGAVKASYVEVGFHLGRGWCNAVADWLLTHHYHYCAYRFCRDVSHGECFAPTREPGQQIGESVGGR